MTWPEAFTYIGGFAAIAATVAAFVFQYLRNPGKAQAALALNQLRRDLDVLKAQVDDLSDGLDDAVRRADVGFERTDAKVEKVIGLFLQTLKKTGA